MMSATSPKPQVSAETLNAARATVRSLLENSPAYAELAEDKRRQLARDLVQVSAFLAEPGMRVAPKHMSPDVLALATPSSTNPDMTVSDSSTRATDQPKFGQAVTTGVEQAVALIQGINFPGFVSGLIEGVFHSIVKSSIEQMEAYGKLVADVSKSLNQFRDENTTANQGRDHLVEQFPDLFELQMPGEDAFGGGFGDEAPTGPRVRLRESADERQAIARVNATLPLDQPITKIDDELVEALLVPAAQTQLATGRQQLLATMVMMGINRIVVTDGKIQAKVFFEFQARDNRRYQASATQFDHVTDQYGNVQKTRGYEGEYDRGSKGGSYSRDKEGAITSDSAGYYSKGSYKYSEKPIIKAMSTSHLQDDSSLQAKASLLGNVEVNFKSDYLPLEKMASPENIAAIQMNAQPGMVKTMAGRPQRPAAAPAAPTATPAATPAAAPATAPAGA